MVSYFKKNLTNVTQFRNTLWISFSVLFIRLVSLIPSNILIRIWIQSIISILWSFCHQLIAEFSRHSYSEEPLIEKRGCEERKFCRRRGSSDWRIVTDSGSDMLRGYTGPHYSTTTASPVSYLLYSCFLYADVHYNTIRSWQSLTPTEEGF